MGLGLGKQTDRDTTSERGLPVSVVIPISSRIRSLPKVLTHVLSLPTMQHQDSEVLVSYISQESWDQRAMIHSKTNRIIMSRDTSASQFEVSKLIHLNYVEPNKQIGCATRYFTATQASNNVVVHLESNIVPTDESMRNGIQSVRREIGFPNYENRTGIPHFYGNTRRACGPRGYSLLKENPYAESAGD